MRIPITEELLTALVEKQLEAHILAEADFTAYDITMALRQEQPNLEILHARVRQLVHERMTYVVSGGAYQTTQRDFGKRWAIVYGPSNELPGSDGLGIPGVPLLNLD
ncbi:MAG TPA: hypothetical protein VLQ48_02935 [Chloroflexia bacterium]|nr:hypothetical protein [Chloroflexia bacterium]